MGYVQEETYAAHGADVIDMDDFANVGTHEARGLLVVRVGGTPASFIVGLWFLEGLRSHRGARWFSGVWRRLTSLKGEHWRLPL